MMTKQTVVLTPSVKTTISRQGFKDGPTVVSNADIYIHNKQLHTTQCLKKKNRYGDIFCFSSVVRYVSVHARHRLPLYWHWVDFVPSLKLREQLCVLENVTRALSDSSFCVWMAGKFDLIPDWKQAVLSCVTLLDVSQCREPWPPRYSLLSGVQELVLAATAVTHPDPHVGPETADCVNVAPLQLSDVHRVHILQPFCIDLKKKKNTQRVRRFCAETLSFQEFY